MNDDPDMPTFNFDQVINPISAYKNEKLVDEEIQFLNDDDFDEFEMPDDVGAVLEEEPLYN